jgi:hypothetical protein
MKWKATRLLPEFAPARRRDDRQPFRKTHDRPASETNAGPDDAEMNVATIECDEQQFCR